MLPHISAKNSIAARLFRVSFFLYIGVAALVAVTQIGEEVLRSRNSVVRELEIFSGSFEGSLARTLWSMDDQEMWEIVQGLLTIPEIVGVKVLDHHDRIPFAAAGAVLDGAGQPQYLDRAGRPAPAPDLSTLSGLFAHRTNLVHRHQVGNTKVGSLVVYANTQVVLARVWVPIALIVGGAVVKTIALWFIFIAVARVLLARPLARLTGAIGALDIRKPDGLVDVSMGGTSGTELDLLERTFNRLTSRLRSEVAANDALRQNLEEKVRLRTAQLEAARADAERSRDAAEAASQAKSRFLAVMSHELRTPMTGMLGTVDLLRGEALPSTQRDLIETLRSSTLALLAIINDVLDFSKIEAGKVMFEATDFHLPSVMAESTDLFRAGAAAKGLSLESVLLVEEPLWVHGDPRRLRQVLVNLIGNAVKFTERGGVTVSLVAAEPADAGTRFTFQVEDTGIGIEPDAIARLFGAFEQADASTTRKYGGSGLGLAIVRGLVEAMGGTVTVHSTPGIGSCFEITVVLGVATVVSASTSAPGSAPAPAGTGRGGRVLVVEDNEVVRVVLAAMLRRAGHRVDMAENGRVCLERLAAGRAYDLILMDVHMPVLDGASTVRAIHASMDAARRVPVIAVTADMRPVVHQQLRTAGFDAVITKPVAWCQLEAVIEGHDLGA